MADDPVPTERSSGPNPSGKRPRSKKRNWRKLWNEHPVKIIGGAWIASVVFAVTYTYKVTNYWFKEELKSQERSAEFNLKNSKKEDQAKYDDLNLRFLATEHRVGDKSVWDLSSIMVTPDQAKLLGNNYRYYDTIDCYLSVPTLGSWSSVETTEDGLWHMLHEDATEQATSEPGFNESQAIGELAKTLKVYLWKRSSSFKVHTVNPQTPTLTVFPYISIEKLDNEVIFKKVFPLLNKLEAGVEKFLVPTLTTLNRQSDIIYEQISHIYEKITQDPVLLHLLPRPSPLPHWSPEQVVEESRRLIAAFGANWAGDAAAFWGSQEIRFGFEHAKEIPKSSFQVLNAEKNGDVFRLSTRSTLPATDPTRVVFWDQETIYFSTGQATVIVTASVPWSPDQRSTTERSWIDAWLAGLKVLSR